MEHFYINRLTTQQQNALYVEEKMNREWLKYIDLSIIDIYPIQFANCDRLASNDSVYIFDEVGSGKTISSGLMALDYMYNNKDKEVLIITTNILSKEEHSEYGQFLKDWYEKLPFHALNLESRIYATNNHYSHFIKKAKYGLVIIDEAQLFLNKESLRFKQLTKNISAEKIIFLTATPIKNSKCDLYTYVDIAKKIIHKNINSDWIDDINTNEKSPDKIICNTFDTKYPVTRYFKDTIMSINIDGYKRTQAKRLLPQLWKYGNGKTKNQVLVENINSKYSTDNRNNFVVFTRFVEKEANEIGNYLELNGFVRYSDDKSKQKTFAIVTGENADELSKYSGTINLPTVLILTYQIAEQGVNLPGFNHVINYHVSSYPSALEQRFGRIDRMGKNGSKFSEINMCFLISEDYCDTNTWNFYCAVSIYLRDLISYLPSKNTMLSEEILDQYNHAQGLITGYIKEITDLVNREDLIDLIKTNQELLDFCEENKIDETEAIECFKKDVKETLSELKGYFCFKKGFSVNKYKSIVKSISDKIFYSDSDMEDNGLCNGDLKTLDAIECGKNISGLPKFKKYRVIFQEQVKFPILVSNYLKLINDYFENLFVRNNFNDLFPDSYKKVFEKMLQTKEFDSLEEVDRKLILENCEAIVNVIPFFKMCCKYKKILQNIGYIEEGKYISVRKRFDFNPFFTAFVRLGEKIKQDEQLLGLSNEFVSLYWTEKTKISELFKLGCKDEVLEASNWYKLSYCFTGVKEAVLIMNYMKQYSEFINNKEENPFYTDSDYYYKSLFYNYIFTDSYRHRAYINPSFFSNGTKINTNDKWTQEIYCELHWEGKLTKLKDFENLLPHISNKLNSSTLEMCNNYKEEES